MAFQKNTLQTQLLSLRSARPKSVVNQIDGWIDRRNRATNERRGAHEGSPDQEAMKLSILQMSIGQSMHGPWTGRMVVERDDPFLCGCVRKELQCQYSLTVISPSHSHAHSDILCTIHSLAERTMMNCILQTAHHSTHQLPCCHLVIIFSSPAICPLWPPASGETSAVLAAPAGPTS